MQFDVKDRLIFLGELIPFQGDLTTWGIVEELESAFSFSDEEKSTARLRQEDGLYLWDDGKVPPKEIPIGPASLDVLLSIYEKKDQAKTLERKDYPIYKRLLQAKHELTPKLHEAGAPGA